MVRRWFGSNRLKEVLKRLRSRMRTKPVSRTAPVEDQRVALRETFRAAQVAHRKGEVRLALLLAHQCDCLTTEDELPGLTALMQELRQQSTEPS